MRSSVRPALRPRRRAPVDGDGALERGPLRGDACARRSAGRTPACTTSRAPRRRSRARGRASARRSPSARRRRPAPRRARCGRARRAARPGRARSGGSRPCPRSARGTGRPSAVRARSPARARSCRGRARAPPRTPGGRPRSCRSRSARRAEGARAVDRRARRRPARPPSPARRVSCGRRRLARQRSRARRRRPLAARRAPERRHELERARRRRAVVVGDPEREVDERRPGSRRAPSRPGRRLIPARRLDADLDDDATGRAAAEPHLHDRALADIVRHLVREQPRDGARRDERVDGRERHPPRVVAGTAGPAGSGAWRRRARSRSRSQASAPASAPRRRPSCAEGAARRRRPRSRRRSPAVGERARAASRPSLAERAPEEHGRSPTARREQGAGRGAREPRRRRSRAPRRRRARGGRRSARAAELEVSVVEKRKSAVSDAVRSPTPIDRRRMPSAERRRPRRARPSSAALEDRCGSTAPAYPRSKKIIQTEEARRRRASRCPSNRYSEVPSCSSAGDEERDADGGADDAGRQRSRPHDGGESVAAAQLPVEEGEEDRDDQRRLEPLPQTTNQP